MLKKLLPILLFLTVFYLFVVPIPVHAATSPWGKCVDNNNVASLQCIPIVFTNIVKAALMFVGSVAVILIIWGGIKFVMSGGDPKQTQGARQIITYAIIGLILVLSSFGIIFLITYLTGAHCLEQLSFTSCT